LDAGTFCGSKRRYRAKTSVFAGWLVDATGKSNCNVAPPGMQIFSHTSQFASVEGFADKSSSFDGGVISCISRTSFS
jgi:hypothetical protein